MTSKLMSYPLKALFVLAIAMLPPLAMATELIGRATVIDADTIEIDGQRVHLYGVDAPELAQLCALDSIMLSCGSRAATFFAKEFEDQQVRCVAKDDDHDAEIQAQCYMGDIDLAAWLVQNGQALAYRKHSEEYADEEEQARAKRIGMWQWPRSFIPPWQWREQHAYSPPGASLDQRLQGPVRKIMALLADSDYVQLSQLANVGGTVAPSLLTAIAAAIEKNGGTIVMPPEHAFETMMTTKRPEPGSLAWNAEMPLWSAEGETPLRLYVVLIERDDQFDVMFFDVE